MRSSPAALRNREAILAVLERVLPHSGRVLEIASGSGEHAVFFAPRLPNLEWQPSDRDAEARESIDAYRTLEPSPNLRPTLTIDVCDDAWPITHADAVVCINMIHASPWESTAGLFRGAARVLERPGAPLALYGAFRMAGKHTAQSNEEFDDWLKTRDPRWGVRDLEAVIEVAREHGFVHDETISMPANNFIIVFRRTGPTVDAA
jgi:hypothetical protein